MSAEGEGDVDGEAEERYLEALERHGLEDVRPACRSLLVELRDADPSAYETAVRRYENELVPAVARGESDPVVAWLRYGAWLADRIRPGRPMAVDPGGRARTLEEVAGDAADAEAGDPGGAPDGSDAEGDAPPFPTRHLVLHLPEEWRDGGLIIGVPREPTDFQAATRELFGG